MENVSESIGIDTINLVKVLDFLPYPFLLSEYRNGTQHNIYVNQSFVNEIGYTCDDIPTIHEWFLKAYPDPVYREEVIQDWQSKISRASDARDDHVIRQARIQTKYSGAKWYEVKASVFGPANFVAFVNIDREISREQELEVLNENKNRILSILSHDLRSPLSSLQIVLELAASDLLTKSEEREVLKKIGQQVFQVNEFLNTTLQWSKLNFAGIHSTIQETDVKSITDKLIMLYQHAITAKSIAVIERMRANIVAWTDREILSIILRNLLSNAIKYTPAGGAIMISDCVQPSGYAIAVENSGDGITADRIKQLMTEHYSSEPGTSGEKGLGLGLKLSRQLLLTIGGTLEIQSSCHATTFKITVPYKKDAVA